MQHNFNNVFVRPVIEAKNVLEYLPENYVNDGTVDYTQHVQKAIDENSSVKLPDFPILINDKGVELRNNSNVFFDENSSLILKPTDKGRYSMLHFNNIKNVNLYNPSLAGDRKNHLGENGEWGMGIRIHDSENINIYNVDIRDTWGDGIYITSYTEESANGILIQGGNIDNARRNDISIISGKSITIDNIKISNTNGALPMAGIDVDPNNITDVIQKFRIN